MKYKIRYDESTNSLVASYIGSESYFKSIVSILVDGAIKQNNENIDSELIYKLIKKLF